MGYSPIRLQSDALRLKQLSLSEAMPQPRRTSLFELAPKCRAECLRDILLRALRNLANSKRTACKPCA